MKKLKLLGMILSVLFLWIVGQPMKAYAKEYSLTDDGWYAAAWADSDKKMDAAPTQLTQDDVLFIYAVPDEESAEYLKNLSGKIGAICVGSELADDESVVIGKEDGSLDATFNLASGNITFNGTSDNIHIYDGNLTVNGDVNFLFLGNSALDDSPSTGKSVINGNVSSVTWYKQRDGISQSYNSFTGDIVIYGTVSSGTIEEAFYDEVLKKNVFAKTGEIADCEAGKFSITNGVLSEQVKVQNIEVTFEYYNQYNCYGPSVGYSVNTWEKQYYNKATNSYAASEDCTQQDIPVGARVTIYDTATPVTIDIDLSNLAVMGGEVIFNGNIVKGEKEGDLFIYTPADDRVCNVTINNPITSITIDHRFNDNSNVELKGSLEQGYYYQNGNQQGYFTCENVQLIKEGVWNESVLIQTSLTDDALSYGVVDDGIIVDALEDEEFGQKIWDGVNEIFKSVEATLKQTTQDIIESITGSDDFKNVLDAIIAKEDNEETKEAKPICAVDISIDSYYREKSSGEIYTANPEYGSENISELPEGNKINFSVKIPKANYKENSGYTIVRQHQNADGSFIMEQLETTQNGDMLTFTSDKFSTFVIVEVAEKKDTSITIANAEGVIVKQDGIFGSNGTFSITGLTAGVYTLSVTRENYVPRTYIAEVETDYETVDVNVELHKTGDITGDETINARDKKMLFNHIAGTAILEDYDFAVADVTGDNMLNARDKKMIYNHIAGTSSLWE